MDSEQVIGVQRENIEHGISLDTENVEYEVLLDAEQQEQNISVDAENVEQEILLNAEQQEQSVNVNEENITVTVNLDYNDLTNKPTKLSDFTDDLGSSPTHTHSQYAESANLATVATSGSYNDLVNKPTIPTVPTKLSDFTDDLGSSPTHTHSQYLTEHQDLSDYVTTDDSRLSDARTPTPHTHTTEHITDMPKKLSAFTDDLGNSPTHTHSQYLTEHQDISGKADVDHTHAWNEIQPISAKTFTNVLATASDTNVLRPFFRMIPTDFNEQALVEYRFRAYVPNHEDLYSARHEITFVTHRVNLCAYSCRNFIGSTSYRPIYYNSMMRLASSTYQSMGHLIGINYYDKANSYSRACTTSGYGRTFEVEIVRAENCTIEWLDTCDVVTRSVSDYVAGTTHQDISNYNGTTQGETHSGDANSNTVSTGYCTTKASTAAKSATCTYGYRSNATYFPCLFRYANTASNATLAISSYAETALPIYVNGARTSSSNTFGAGVVMFLYYNDAYYCYNDGRLPIVYNGAVTSIQDALASLQS